MVCVVPAGCGAHAAARFLGDGTGGSGKLGSPNWCQAACVAAATHRASYAVRAECGAGPASDGPATPAATARAAARTARRRVGRSRDIGSAFPQRKHGSARRLGRARGGPYRPSRLAPGWQRTLLLAADARDVVVDDPVTGRVTVKRQAGA